ncbi:hypothetical protein [Clostridium felsineum]|uniref:hypothetical protein n=1 Tax=Clostridium felsineum TaxID=36839 RepID=UPI00098BF15D|nr:hypothetical protein [Clostridium felsineum]URZ15445.1 hypothetical protein CLFE_014850 [Clostridium felsineum DSM 794]
MSFKNKFSWRNIVYWSKNKASPWLEKKERYMMMVFLFGLVGFILGILLLFLNKNLARGIMGIGFIIMIVILFFYSLIQFLKDPDAIVIIISSIVAFVVISIAIGQGILEIVSAYFTTEKEGEMVGYYSSLTSGVFSAIIGVAGAIIGAKIGGKKSYEASMDAIEKQIHYDKSKYENEKQEEIKKVQEMIDYFLREEIIYNFKRLEMFNENNKKILIDSFKNNRFPSYNYYNVSNMKDRFKFDEFNNIKYKYLNYLSKEIIDIYRMFSLLERGSFNKLNKKEREYVGEAYLNYYLKYTY